jgi:exonuclease III
MKIVSWNCNGAFRKKYHFLDSLEADILVIQECEDPTKSDVEYRSWAQNHLWYGKTKNKGIGIFAKTGIQLEKIEWPDDGLELFLPCRIDNNFNVLAVWTKHANSPNFAYIGQFWKYLQKHKVALSSGRTIICGDFNSNVRWDEWDRWWNHSDVVRELGELSILSLYHHVHAEIQGGETRPTFFLHRDRAKSYHIDYAFVSDDLVGESPVAFEVGEMETWLPISDHLPTVFSLPSLL